MQNLQLFIVKPLPITTHRGRRVSIKDVRFDKTVIIEWPQDINYSGDVALQFLQGKGYNIIGQASDKNLDYFMHDPKGQLFVELTKHPNEYAYPSTDDLIDEAELDKVLAKQSK